MATIQDYKKDSTLSKVFRFDEGVMSRREWLKLKQVQGWNAEEKQVRNLAAEGKMEERLRRDKMNVPLGNPNYPSTKKYLQEVEELKQGIFKTEYRLTNGSSLFDITKTEYDYFQNLQLSEDLNTERSNISEDEAMEKEIEFFSKYCTD